jgi:hypothetical protein
MAGDCCYNVSSFPADTFICQAPMGGYPKYPNWAYCPFNSTVITHTCVKAPAQCTSGFGSLSPCT